METQPQVKDRNYIITDPPVVDRMFGSTRWAWVWLIPRLYIGYTWLDSGLGKIGNPAWMQTGEALRGFWTNAVRIPDAPAPPARPPPHPPAAEHRSLRQGSVPAAG